MPEIGVYDSVETLLGIPFVAWWSKQDGFLRFSFAASRFRSDHGYLMADWTNGSFNVIGYLDGAAPPELPKWVAPTERSGDR